MPEKTFAGKKAPVKGKYDEKSKMSKKALVSRGFIVDEASYAEEIDGVRMGSRKLVKTKKLKGSLEGYIEEKYELESEGRYSTIKLELERFNSNVESEIIELQQYFDYMQD